MAKLKNAKPALIISNGILCDSVRIHSNKKVDAYGILTMFWAWGYPASRASFLVLNVFNIPDKDVVFTVKLHKVGGQKTQTIYSHKVDGRLFQNKEDGVCINVQLNYNFLSAGNYDVVCSFNGFDSTLKIPFVVKTHEWPEFTEQEYQYVQENTETLNKISVQVICKGCSKKYLFEEAVLRNYKTKGAFRIPENGSFACTKCKRVIRLRDIQGFLRASIKNNISNNILNYV